MYQVLFLEDAERDLKQLDPTIAKRIYKRIQWLADNFEHLPPESLTGEWARFFKFRVGDYRIIYKTLHDEHLLAIYRVRHRREVYERK